MGNQNPKPTTPPVENPVPQAVIAPPSKSFLSNKIILLIVILLILLGLGGTYLALNSKIKSTSTVSQSASTSAPSPTPTSDSTSGWKTYTNTAYGFSIKYPTTFVMEDKSGQLPPFAMYFLDKQRVVTREGGSQVNPYFFMVAKPFEGSVMDYVSDTNNNRTFVETKKIGNNEFIVAKEKFGMGGVANEYLLKAKENIISISPDLAESKDSVDYKVLNQILSTFRFD